MMPFIGGAVAASVLVLSACSGTTYGTGTPTDQQLVQDLTGVLSLGPKDKPTIDYSPRPGIVKPPSTEVLPPPQEDVAASGNPAWPESPEQRLARVRAEATANQDNPFYRPSIVRDGSGVAPSGTQAASLELTEGGMVKPDILTPGSHRRAQQRQAVQQRRVETQQGSPTTRRYLSEPPVEYRQPSEAAPVGELGEDEAKKERTAKRAGAGTGGLRKLLPWLN